MITIEQYLMGRESIYPDEYTPEIKANAEMTVSKVNALLEWLKGEGLPLEKNKQGSLVNSGWRPPQINGQTKNAAPKSKHMTGQACDLYDPEGDIDAMLMSGIGQAKLAEIGLWMENPAATKGWSHVQTIPPRSGQRTFYP